MSFSCHSLSLIHCPIHHIILSLSSCSLLLMYTVTFISSYHHAPYPLLTIYTPTFLSLFLSFFVSCSLPRFFLPSLFFPLFPYYPPCSHLLPCVLISFHTKRLLLATHAFLSLLMFTSPVLCPSFLVLFSVLHYFPPACILFHLLFLCILLAYFPPLRFAT